MRETFCVSEYCEFGVGRKDNCPKLEYIRFAVLKNRKQINKYGNEGNGGKNHAV